MLAAHPFRRLLSCLGVVIFAGVLVKLMLDLGGAAERAGSDGGGTNGGGPMPPLPLQPAKTTTANARGRTLNIRLTKASKPSNARIYRRNHYALLQQEPAQHDHVQFERVLPQHSLFVVAASLEDALCRAAVRNQRMHLVAVVVARQIG